MAQTGREMSQEIKEINNILERIVADDSAARAKVSGRGDPLDQLSKNINKLAEKLQSFRQRLDESVARATEINDVLLTMMTMDFSRTASIGDGESPFDGIAAAVNVLAEEYSFAIAKERERISELEAKARIIENQREAIRELSTPILQIWDEIIVLPLIGAVDTLRARQMLEGLLNAVSKSQAQVAIIDITGVPAVDTAVAQHLLAVAAANKMLGAKTIITGVSPHNAQVLVKQGVNLHDIETRGSLRTGLLSAFELTNKKIVSK